MYQVLLRLLLLLVVIVAAGNWEATNIEDAGALLDIYSTRSTQIEPLKLIGLSTSCSTNNKGRETDKLSEFQKQLLTFDCVNAD
jgi:hypothetical protein